MVMSGLIVLLTLAVAAAPTAQQIADRVRRHLDPINDYVCDITFSAKGPQFYVGKTVVKAYYRKPGRVHFEAKEGFAVLPKDTFFVGDPFESVSDRLSDARVTSASLDGVRCYVITVPGGRDADGWRSEYWVDSRNWLVVKTAVYSGPGEEMSSRISYVKVDSAFWMPSRVGVRAKNSDQRGRRRGGPFEADIVFSNYTVNKGIPESVFKSGG